MEWWKNEIIEDWNNACSVYPVKFLSFIRVNCNACPVHPVGFMDLSYGVKFEVRKYFTREGAISTGERGFKRLIVAVRK